MNEYKIVTFGDIFPTNNMFEKSNKAFLDLFYFQTIKIFNICLKNSDWSKNHFLTNCDYFSNGNNTHRFLSLETDKLLVQPKIPDNRQLHIFYF